MPRPLTISLRRVLLSAAFGVLGLGTVAAALGGIMRADRVCGSEVGEVGMSGGTQAPENLDSDLCQLQSWLNARDRLPPATEHKEREGEGRDPNDGGADLLVVAGGVNDQQEPPSQTRSIKIPLRWVDDTKSGSLDEWADDSIEDAENQQPQAITELSPGWSGLGSGLAGKVHERKKSIKQPFGTSERLSSFIPEAEAFRAEHLADMVRGTVGGEVAAKIHATPARMAASGRPHPGAGTEAPAKESKTVTKSVEVFQGVFVDVVVHE